MTARMHLEFRTESFRCLFWRDPLLGLYGRGDSPTTCGNYVGTTLAAWGMERIGVRKQSLFFRGQPLRMRYYCLVRREVFRFDPSWRCRVCADKCPPI